MNQLRFIFLVLASIRTKKEKKEIVFEATSILSKETFIQNELAKMQT